MERKINIDKDKLQKLYLDEQKSIDNIAKMYHCSYWTIRDNLIRYNTPLRKRWEKAIEKRGFLASVKLTSRSLQILDGIMLGDGHIRRPYKNYNTRTSSIQMTQTIKQKQFVHMIQKELQKENIECKTYDHISRLDGKEYPQIGFYTKAYIEFRQQRDRWYPNGLKIVPRDVELTPLTMAYWFMCDGYCSTVGHRTDRPRTYYRLAFCTDSFTRDDTTFLMKKINDTYHVNFKVSPYLKGYRIQNTHINEVSHMIDILSPYVSSDLRYKLKRINVNHLRKFWSDEEIKKLKKEYPEHGTNIKELLENGRTRQSIKSMARVNSIHFIS